MMSVLLLLLMTLTSSVASRLSSTTCGVRPLDSEKRSIRSIRSSPEQSGYIDDVNKWVQSEGNIVGGDTAESGSVPWQGRVHRKFWNLHWCGVTILNEFWLLSAAQCFYNVAQGEFEIIIGEHSINETDPEEQHFEIDEVIIHEKYNASTLDNAIALIRIKPSPEGRGIQYGYFVRPICLPEYDYDYEEDTDCTVSGWGIIHYRGDKSPDQLRIATVPLISQSKCRDFYRDYHLNITDSMVCAGFTEGKVDACQSDSGGPLISEINGVYTSIGIVSWGDGCAWAKYPGVYTRVSVFVPWIQYQINSHSLTEAQSTLPSKPK